MASASALSALGPRDSAPFLRTWRCPPARKGARRGHANARREFACFTASRGDWGLGRADFRAQGWGPGWVGGTGQQLLASLGCGPQSTVSGGGKRGRDGASPISQAENVYMWVWGVGVGGGGGQRPPTVAPRTLAGRRPRLCPCLRSLVPWASLSLSVCFAPHPAPQPERERSYSLFLCLRTLTSRDREERSDSGVRGGRGWVRLGEQGQRERGGRAGAGKGDVQRRGEGRRTCKPVGPWLGLPWGPQGGSAQLPALLLPRGLDGAATALVP